MGRVLCLASGLLVALGASSARAQIEPLQTGGPSRANRETTQSARALAARDYDRALSAADASLKVDSRDPWAHYDRASALRGLGRTDQAVAEFRRAQSLFGSYDRWGMSVALWGEADALSQVGRCAEAQRAFEEYMSFVRRDEPQAAEMARKYAAECAPPRR